MLILWFSLSSSLTHLHPKALTHTHPEALTHTHPKALTHTHPEALICRCELISALKDLEHAHIIGRAQSHQLQQTKQELAAQSKQLNLLQKENSMLKQRPKVTLGQSSSMTTTNRSDGTKLETKTIVPYVTVNGVRVVDGAALVNKNGNLQSAGVGRSTTRSTTHRRAASGPVHRTQRSALAAPAEKEMKSASPPPASSGAAAEGAQQANGSDGLWYIEMPWDGRKIAKHLPKIEVIAESDSSIPTFAFCFWWSSTAAAMLMRFEQCVAQYVAQCVSQCVAQCSEQCSAQCVAQCSE